MLYVEQATFRDLKTPYRQRSYSLENVDGRMASHVYGMNLELEGQLVGACDNPESILAAKRQLEKKDGCTVWFDQDSNGYIGSTKGDACKNNDGNATYKTSEVHVSADVIEVLDQGWDNRGNQAWGSTEGPYIFDRLD